MFGGLRITPRIGSTLILVLIVFVLIPIPVRGQGSITVGANPHLGNLPGDLLHISGTLQTSDSSGQLIYIQIYNSDGSLAHQDLTDTITDIDGSYSKYWILPESAPSGCWQVAVAWSNDVLVQDTENFIVGKLSLAVNDSIVCRNDSLSISGFLEGNGNSGQSIYLQILENSGVLIYQNLDTIVTDENGSFEIEWSVPDLGSNGWWSVVAAWADNNLINGVIQFCVISTVEDVTPPLIDHPDDIIYSEGTTGHWLTWNPTDLNPFSFEILRNHSIVLSDYWSSSAEPINISIDGLTLGNYNYTLIVFDAFNNSASDTILVTIRDTTEPELNHPGNIELILGDESQFITWFPSDLHPYSYVLFVNNYQTMYGLWNVSSEIITIPLEDLVVGGYNFTLLVHDTSGNTASDTVIVTVIEGDTTPPVLDSPSDVFMTEGTTILSLTWHPSDLHPLSYEILRNNSCIKSGIWNSSGELISLSLDSLFLGTYNFTLVVTDIGDNWASDSVFVFVQDGTPPLIDHPLDIEFVVDAVGQQIVWHPSDLHPSSYEILRNGIQIKKGLWNLTSESIIVSLDEFDVGVHNVTIIVMDIGGNTVSDSVEVTILESTTTTTTTITTTTTVTTTTTTTANTTTLRTTDNNVILTIIIVSLAGIFWILIIFVVFKRRLAR